jgi:hypothetical protein
MKPTVLSRGIRTRNALRFCVFGLLALSACGAKPPQWEGSFTGAVEEKMEEKDRNPNYKTTKDFAVKENVTVSVASQSERDKIVTFGDCKVRFHSDQNPVKDIFQASPGQICKVNFAGYSGDFEIGGYVTLNRNKETGKELFVLTLNSDSLEKMPYSDVNRMIYSYYFKGERK